MPEKAEDAGGRHAGEEQDPGAEAIAVERRGFARTRSSLREFSAAFRQDLKTASARGARRLKQKPPVARAVTAPRQGRPQRRSAVARTLRGVGLIALAALAGGIFVAVWALRDIPWKAIADGSLNPVVVLEAADGQQLVSQGPYQGAYADLQDFPQSLIDAVISAEDRRFYEHPGIDAKASGAPCSAI